MIKEDLTPGRLSWGAKAIRIAVSQSARMLCCMTYLDPAELDTCMVIILIIAIEHIASLMG